MLGTKRERSHFPWQATAAAACFISCAGSGLIGTLLTTGWILDAHLHPSLHNLGLILLILVFPLLILGGHCLDLLDRKRKMAEGDGRGLHHGPLHVAVVIVFLPILFISSGNVMAQQPGSRPAQREQTDIAAPSVAVSDEHDQSRDEKDASVTTQSSLFELATAPQTSPENKNQEQSEDTSASTSKPRWQYGGFLDLAYLLDFNHPANHLFRSRGTAFRVDRVFLNMAAFYVRKKATEQSRWGVEATAQAGKDAEFFGFSATAPNIGGFKFLRQLGPTNVSYLAPVGKGLALQAGIFPSLIGYDSLYAKDNSNYTRPWGADFTPYFMMGANASYPFNEKLTGTFFLVNGYWHLARANSAPSAGGQIAYKLTPRATLKETTLFGPHQRNTSFEFWRFLTDTIVERKTDKFTLAFEYIFSTERVDAPGKPRALMMSWQLPGRWTLNDRWSVAFRPEVFWDRDGRWTLASQTVKAFTTTLEYRVPYRWTNTILRLEHRFDDSRGPDGGFFRGAELNPGVTGLTPRQHLLILATILTFDSPTSN